MLIVDLKAFFRFFVGLWFHAKIEGRMKTSFEIGYIFIAYFSMLAAYVLCRRQWNHWIWISANIKSNRVIFQKSLFFVWFFVAQKSSKRMKKKLKKKVSPNANQCGRSTILNFTWMEKNCLKFKRKFINEKLLLLHFNKAHQ